MDPWRFLWDSSTENAAQELDTTPSRWNIQQGARPTGSWAAFGQATYPVTDRFRATMGLRYSFDNKKQEYRIYYVNAEGVRTVDTGIVSYGDKLTKPTWKLGAEYDLGTNSMAYITVAQGYKSGGVRFDYNMFQGDPTGTSFTLADLGDEKFKEETSIAYELGSKNRFLDNRLQINASLFLTAYKGLQVMMWKRLNEDDETSDPVQFIANGGKTSPYGAEIETTWLATFNDRINMSMSTMRGKYHDLVIKYDNLYGPVEVATRLWTWRAKQWLICPSSALPWVTVSHSFDFADYGSLSATIDTTYKTDYYNTIEITNPGARVPSFHISNFYLSWASPNGMFSAAANVKNIENKAYAVNYIPERGVGLRLPKDI